MRYDEAKIDEAVLAVLYLTAAARKLFSSELRG
jgi:hypothetical protein